MLRRHFLDLLPEYCEGLLSQQKAGKVSDHLRNCHSCREACERIRLSIEALQQLPAEELSEDAARRMRESFRRRVAAPPVPRRSAFMRWAVAASLAAALAAGAVFLQRHRPIEMRAQSQQPPELETLALQLHRERLEGRLPLDLKTSSAAEARDWMKLHTGVVADIAMLRPEEDGDSYQLEGLRRIQAGNRVALLVAFRIDSHPVTLITARSRDFAGAPPEAALAKRVFYHTEASGQKVITWSISGQSYSLISELPGYGQQGCFICHTDASRRAAIRNMTP